MGLHDTREALSEEVSEQKDNVWRLVDRLIKLEERCDAWEKRAVTAEAKLEELHELSGA